ncbi:MAG: pallilysin-related adhesin [Spirochaetia bacterium]
MIVHHAAPRVLLPALVFFVCALCAGCQRGAGARGVTYIVPQPLGGSPAAPAESSGNVDLANSGAQRPRISIDPSFTVLQVINANLDQDPNEEQLIAVKRRDDVSAPVRIIIADADPERGTYYYQSWEADTNATDSRTFSLSLKDMIGDHGIQIVASGMNESGKLTLDVFKPLPRSQGKGLAYKPICQLVADDIAIVETDRPDSYSTDLKPGASFPIVATLRDPDSENVMDLVSIRYLWNPAEDRYVPEAAVKKPGDQVQQAQLQTLFASPGEDSFEQFIAGSWIQIQSSAGGKARDAGVSLIDFDPQNRKISLSSGNTQEAYLWRESHRTLPNKLWVIGENETVLLIQLDRTFTITVDTPASITVTISGNDTSESTTAQYTKVTDEIRRQLIDRPDAQVTLSQLSLAGAFVGAMGVSIDFQTPRLTWSDASGKRSGTFLLFSLGTRTILSVRFKTEDGAPDQISSWLADLQEKKEPARTVRTLSLSPVQLTMNGYEDANGDALSLQQIQPVKK